VKGWLVAAIVGTAAPALAGAGRAGPLADALSRHGEADITALRAQARTSADARCTLGAIYAKLGDLPRAALFLDGCDGAKLDPDIADAVARADADVQRALRASQLSAISIDSDPPGLAVETDALPGEAITTPATVWARAGTYYVKGNTQTTMLQLERHTRASVVLDNHPHSAQHPARTHTVDFLDEPTDPTNTGPPPTQKHPSLLPCKYTGCDTHAGETLDDPFALHAARVPGLPDFALGARVGTSAAFHDGASRIAMALAVDGRMRAGRFPGLGPAVVDVRLDWAPRGTASSTDGSFEAFGASAQYGIVLFAPRAAWLTWLGGIRGELRTDQTMPGPRTALGYTTALELALRSLPITLGVRYDQDREQALIVEIGFDLRDGVH
jgi:hypothetical protein